MRKISFLSIALILLIIGTQTMGIYSQKMPDNANKLYQDFSIAIETSDLAGLEATLCKASAVKMKNYALSGGMKFPEDVFALMKYGLLDFKKLRYISFKKNGPTVNAYYIYTEDKIESTIVTLCMVEEAGKLRIIELKTRDAQDFITNLYHKDYSFLNLAEFKPSGIAPETPEPIAQVEHIANYTITCYGYTISLQVNGIFQEEVKNTSRRGIVYGGLKTGENTIEFSIEKTDLNEKEIPAIAILMMINSEREAEVFYFNEDLVGKSIQRTFTVQ